MLLPASKKMRVIRRNLSYEDLFFIFLIWCMKIAARLSFLSLATDQYPHFKQNKFNIFLENMQN